MSEVRWKPNVTVAAYIEHEGKLLWVRELTSRDGIRINNAAGHLEADEDPLQAVPLARETPLDAAAALIADGLLARRRRVFVPGWVRALFVLRSALHTRPVEREQLAAAPELEALYLEDARDGRLPGRVSPAP